jgi:tripartite-type tricarboxylate transporter receptor subunit TctC
MEAAMKRVHDSQAWKDFATRNNYEDMWMGSGEFGKLLASLSVEMNEFLAHISAPQK